MGDINSTTLSKGENVVARSIDDELILVPIHQNATDVQCFYTSNEVGSYVWSLIDGSRSLKDIVDAVANEYDVSQEQAELDIQEFVEQLTKAGCVEKLTR